MKNLLLCLVFPFFINAQSAFISGNDTVCDNGVAALVKIDFNGVAPFTFVYSINGVSQPAITTTINPYIISSFDSGTYTLVSFYDANFFGILDGSAKVNVLESPTARIHLQSDTLSVLYPVANFVSGSDPINSIVSWEWSFGDNTGNDFSEEVSHIYADSSAIYEAGLIVVDDNSCSDTARRVVFVKDEFWIYIPDSFTPDYDMVNDKFCIEYNGIRENTFLFKVFNSQGDLMFQSTNPLELRCVTGGGWDGKHIDNNIFLPADTYAYEIYFQDHEGWKHQEYGIIILVI